MIKEMEKSSILFGPEKKTMNKKKKGKPKRLLMLIAEKIMRYVLRIRYLNQIISSNLEKRE